MMLIYNYNDEVSVFNVFAYFDHRLDCDDDDDDDDEEFKDLSCGAALRRPVVSV